MGTPGPFGTLPLSWADTSFQLLLDALPDAVFIVDSTAKIVAANNQAGIIFGYNRNDLIGSLITALVPPGLRDRLDLAFKEYFRDPNARPGAVGLELLVQRRDGTDFPAEINLSSISTDASTFIIITIRDVSAMNRLSELNESPVVSDGNYENEEGSWLSVDFESIMTWASGTDKLCTYFSSQWLAFTGRSMEQEWGNGWAQGVHPNDLQRCLYVFSQAFDRREKFKLEFRLRRHDGEYRWIFELGVPRFNSDHTFAGYVGSCVEVTSLNRMEEALREKEMELLESQRLAGVGSWNWNVENETVTWSEELYRIAGRDPALPAPTYEEHSKLFTSESWERLSRSLGEALQDGTPEELDLEIVRPDGTARWVRVHGEAQRDNGGRIVRIRGTAQDITDRKKTEKELLGVSGRLLEAQEQERSRIARDLHDDISQRLALLVNDMGALERILQESAAETQIRIHEIGIRASEITTDIQDISHQLHSSKLQYLGIAAAAKIFCKEFSEHENLEIDFHSVDIPSNVPDNISLCLFRVLQEALHNGAKHSGVSYMEVYLRGFPNEVQLTIRDRGAGFDPEEVMKRSGLGLISIRERVGLVGGAFSIISKPQAGTEISVRVPISQGLKASRASG